MSARKDNGNQCSQDSLMFPTAKGLPGVAFNVQFSFFVFFVSFTKRVNMSAVDEEEKNDEEN